MEALVIIAQQQFLSLMQQVAHAHSPMKVKISKTEQIWVQEEQQHKDIEKSIEFANRFCRDESEDEVKNPWD